MAMALGGRRRRKRVGGSVGRWRRWRWRRRGDGGDDGGGDGGGGGGGGGAAGVAGGGASVTFACAVGRSRLMTRLTDEGQTSGSITAGRAWDEIPSLRAERDVKLH